MWHKLLRLQFAMAPLDVLDWMLERGLAAIIEAYGASIAEGRIACRVVHRPLHAGPADFASSRLCMPVMPIS